MTGVHQSLQLPVTGVELQADVAVPDGAAGVVLFAHGSGSGRHSPRNRYVAQELQDGGLGTVLVDLLTVAEEQVDAVDATFRFDIPLLAARLVALIDWLAGEEATAGLGVGLFGASTGAAAALVAAAERPTVAQAVVSRGGRVDLAGESLRAVRQPTLLIVGEYDPVVLELNRNAMAYLGGETHLETVPRAGHLFAEPGALEQVARLARQWFQRYLGEPAADR